LWPPLDIKHKLEQERDAAAMAAAHTTTKLQALVATLQDEVTALRATRAASATELQALVATLLAEVSALRAARAASTGVVFTDTPQTLGANDLIDNSSKQGSEIYKQSIMPSTIRHLPMAST